MNYEKYNSRYKFNRFGFYKILLGVLCFLCYVPSSSGGTCNAVPVSLSDLQLCNGNTCYFSQQVAAAIPLQDGASLCMDFVSPDDKDFKFSVTIDVLHAHYRWDMDYSYYTDAPYVSTLGYCSCSLFDSYDCSINGVTKPTGDVTFCNQGYHDGSTCTGGKAAAIASDKSYKVYNALTGKNRFKVIKFKPIVTLDLGLAISITNTTTSFVEYDGTIQQAILSNNRINFTVVSDTNQVSFTPEFVVYDHHAPTDFYMFSSSEVNGLNEYSTGKLGWYKTDQAIKTQQGIQSMITTKVKDCSKNVIETIYPWLKPIDFLYANRDKISAAMAPGAYLFDSQFNADPSDKKTVPNHILTPYNYLRDGWIVTDVTGNPVFVGMTDGGQIVPIPTQALTSVGLTVQTNKGLQTQDNWLKSSFLIYDKLTSAQKYVEIVTLAADQYSYGVCLYDVPSTVRTCQNITFQTTGWPTLEPTLYKFTDHFYESPLIANSSVNPILYTEMTSGVANVLVQFFNLSVSFESSTIQPRINSISFDQAANTVTINAQSVTTGGVCYVYSTPTNFIITQSIALTVAAKDYVYDIESLVYLGNVDIGVRCQKNLATKSVQVAVNYTQIGQNVTVNDTAPTDNPGDSFNPFGFFQNWSIPNLLGDFNFGSGPSLSDKIVGWLLLILKWVLIAFAIGVGLAIIWWLLKMIWLKAMKYKGYKSYAKSQNYQIQTNSRPMLLPTEPNLNYPNLIRRNNNMNYAREYYEI